ncbi:hypothetical protein TNCV_712171 [Trichonephila clavipes]|nr:hypothetical protein TNCV_712171 [Trichonephila clavipes]
MIEKDNVMYGTMVIVKEDFTPVCNWLLGRVVEVYHGSDGKSCINILVWFPETKTHRDHFPNTEHDIQLESERAIVAKPYRMSPRQI